jgi:hypothetical protein
VHSLLENFILVVNNKNKGNDMEKTNKLAWKSPTISYIDIKRTMGGSGANSDNPTGTTSA